MQTRIHQLILKQLKGKLSPEERLELDEFTARSPENKKVVENLTDPKQLSQMIKLSRELNVDAAWQKISSPGTARVVSMRRCIAAAVAQMVPRRRFVAAAAALMIIGIAGWALLDNIWKKGPPTVKEEIHSSPYHHAILTLGNGQVLKLNELKDGSLSQDPKVIKYDGQLVYPFGYDAGQPGINTLETPRGSFYSVRLPDGSTVLLNSGSSIKYPNSFTGDKRTVMVQGAAYFDVAKNPAKPFIVQSMADGSEIEVVGTRFLVNAYKGDSISRITLIEGKVKVKGDGYTDSLEPGEELTAWAGGKVQKVGVENAEARVQGWAENKFKWVHTDVRTLLEDLSHWYGYSLNYKITVPIKTYTIAIDRSEPLPNVLKVLHAGTGLNFKLDGTTIVVY